MLRPRFRSLLARLLAATLVPTLCLFAAFGALVYRVTERSLDESLGRRLTGIAGAAASQILPEAVLFLSPGDEESRTAQRQRHKLLQLRARTRVARIFVLDDKLRGRIDTQAGTRIGDRYYHAEADRSELARVFAGEEASSVLFVGERGELFKTGYAPILDAEGKAVAALGVEASAEFYSALRRLRNYLLLGGAVVAILVAFASAVVARRSTRPLRLLAREASRIGAGELERPIDVLSRDEVGLLAATMNEMREGLFQRDQHMQMMLSGIAHEVRNPLGGIELFSGLLREDLAGDEEKLQHVRRIERELHHLKKVVVDFLDYARRVPPALERGDLSGLAHEVAEVLRKDAAERQVEIVVAAPEETPVRCDRESMRRVLINLAQNAIQATSPGGQVEIRTSALGAEARCQVNDRGCGIPPEVLPKVFTPFFTTREKGTGLGLALAKKIVEDHGGRLEATSEPGTGSTFTVTLPRGTSDGNGSGD